MSWEDYEKLDATREVATEEELEKLKKQYGLPSKKEEEAERALFRKLIRKADKQKK